MLAAIVIVFLTMPVVFATNDDGMAQLIMAGKIAPEPAGYVPFMGLIVPWLVSRLFVIAPAVSWWPITHLVTIAVSLAFAGFALDRMIATRWNAKAIWLRCLALTSVNTCLFGPLITSLQFTTTGTLAISTGAFGALILNSSSLKSETGRFSRIAIPVLLSLFSVGYRPLCAQLGVVFWAVVVLAGIVVAQGNTIRRRLLALSSQIAAITFAAAAVGGMSLVCSMYFSSAGEWRAGWDLAVAQSTYTDFPDTPYALDQEFYDSIGWDYDLTRLARGWFQMDERQTTEAYTAINERNTMPLDNLIEHPFATVESRLQPVLLWVPVTYMCLGASLLLASNVRLQNRSDRLFALGLSALGILLVGYLILRGRVNERALYSVLMPYAGAMFSLLLLRGSRARDYIAGMCFSRFLSIALVSAFAVFLIRMGASGYITAMGLLLLFQAVCCVLRAVTPHWMERLLIGSGLLLMLCLVPATVRQGGWGSENYQSIAVKREATDKLFDLCEQTPDTFYIYDMTGYYIPTDLWSIRWPSNQTNWGGWKNTYFWYKEALQRDGYSGIPTSKDFLDQNVRFVCGNKDNARLLLHYLQGRFGSDIQMVQERTIGDTLVVYRFERH